LFLGLELYDFIGEIGPKCEEYEVNCEEYEVNCEEYEVFSTGKQGLNLTYCENLEPTVRLIISSQ